MKILVKISLTLILLAVSFSGFSKPAVSMLFNIGLGANGSYEIGGTLKNNNDTEIAHTAITYITIDEQCQPGPAQVANLGPIQKEATLEFRIPVAGKLYSYRILNVASWNVYGIPLETEDQTATIIKARDAKTEKMCQAKNSAADAK